MNEFGVRLSGWKCFHASRRSKVVGTKKTEQGFSMIEGLIAFGVLLLIALGVIPVFIKSMANNSAGAGYLDATNMARNSVEELRILPFSSPRLTVPPGETELVVDEFFSFADREWKPGDAPTGDPGLWFRTITVRQYNNNDRKEDDHQYDAPLSGDTNPDFVHIKEIEVMVRSGRRGGPLGTGKGVTFKYLKTF